MSVVAAGVRAEKGSPPRGEVASISAAAGARRDDPVKGLLRAAHEHGLRFKLDAAVYDQSASETLSGPPNLATMAWQFSGSWRLLNRSRWGSGALGWTLLGSQDLGDGSQEETMSQDVGSISGLNANMVQNATAIDELYWRHESANRRWSVLVGRVDQAAHFDANRVANDGYRQFFAFAFENNLSIPWPTYGGFGGVLRLDLGADNYVLGSIAAMNDDPRVPWSAAGHEGWNQIVELGVSHVVQGLGRGHVRVTAWHNRIPGADGFGVGVNLDQELADGSMLSARDDRRSSTRQLIGFFRAGVGQRDVTPVQAFASGGVALDGPFGRARDRMAIGVAWSDPSPGAGERDETLIEAYYRLALSPILSLTGDVQFVVDPALNPAAKNSVVLGLRLHLEL